MDYFDSRRLFRRMGLGISGLQTQAVGVYKHGQLRLRLRLLSDADGSQNPASAENQKCARTAAVKMPPRQIAQSDGVTKKAFDCFFAFRTVLTIKDIDGCRLSIALPQAFVEQLTILGNRYIVNQESVEKSGKELAEFSHRYRKYFDSEATDEDLNLTPTTNNHYCERKPFSTTSPSSLMSILDVAAAHVHIGVDFLVGMPG